MLAVSASSTKLTTHDSNFIQVTTSLKIVKWNNFEGFYTGTWKVFVCIGILQVWFFSFTFLPISIIHRFNEQFEKSLKEKNFSWKSNKTNKFAKPYIIFCLPYVDYQLRKESFNSIIMFRMVPKIFIIWYRIFISFI